jgi:hypothetical protein
MTKLVKLSLAAAIAVSGLTSTVAAKPLEEAIKGVDVSGTVVYRYDDRQDDVSDSSTTTNSYKAAINIKAPVNDIVTFNGRVSTDVSLANKADMAGLDTQGGGDANPTLHLTEAYFTAKMGMLTVNAGKQGIATPWTVAHDAAGDEDTGTGILALVDAGGVATIATGYFNQSNIVGATDLAVLAVIAPIGPVNFDAWYLDADDVLDTYTIGLSGSFMGVELYTRYTSVDPDAVGTKDQDLWKIGAKGKLGPVGLAVEYANTDNDGSSFVSLNDCDAITGAQAWAVNACGKADADYWEIAADMDLMPGLNFGLHYADVDYEIGADDVDEDEFYGQLTYDMSENFTTYIRYGTYDRDAEHSATTDIDQTRGRLHVQYSF